MALQCLWNHDSATSFTRYSISRSAPNAFTCWIHILVLPHRWSGVDIPSNTLREVSLATTMERLAQAMS